MRRFRVVAGGRGTGRGHAAWAVVAVCLAVVSPATPARAAAAVQEFEFPGLNRTYRDLPAAAQPIQSGLFTIRLSSPNQELVVARHRLRLRPRSDGTHDAEAWAEFSGGGRMYADVSAGGLEHRFQDDVVLPPQEQTVQGRLRIERDREGYWITTLELPSEIRVQLQSRLGGEILGWCQTLAAIPFSPFRCVGLDRALSNASVPLPPPGDTYLLPAGDLTTDERKRLDAYLSASTPAAPAPRKEGAR